MCLSAASSQASQPDLISYRGCCLPLQLVSGTAISRPARRASICRSSGATSSWSCWRARSWTGGCRPTGGQTADLCMRQDGAAQCRATAGQDVQAIHGGRVGNGQLLPGAQHLACNSPLPCHPLRLACREAAGEDVEEHILPLLDKYPGRLRPDYITLPNFHAAASLVASRAFGVDEWHGETSGCCSEGAAACLRHGQPWLSTGRLYGSMPPAAPTSCSGLSLPMAAGDAMVPLADIFNHKASVVELAPGWVEELLLGCQCATAAWQGCHCSLSGGLPAAC